MYHFVSASVTGNHGVYIHSESNSSVSLCLRCMRDLSSVQSYPVLCVNVHVHVPLISRSSNSVYIVDSARAHNSIFTSPTQELASRHCSALIVYSSCFSGVVRDAVHQTTHMCN